MNLDFGGLLLLLHARAVAFVTVGGAACVFNGHVRLTEDVDILVAANDGNVRLLLAVLSEWGEGYARDLTPAAFTLEPGAIRLVEDFPLDIFTTMAGLTYEDVIGRALRTPDGVPFLHPADLLATKVESHRPKDQQDVLVLREIVHNLSAPPASPPPA